jgi:deazaflavin-dependent oxidoreductase (nitroreductase family)
LVPFFNAIARPLVAAGVPMGFNGLVTIRGRKSGLPRTTPLAITEVSVRRWVWSPWGEVQWVRNLRAAGRATIIVRRRTEEMRATELDPTQRVGFFRDVLRPLARSIPSGVWFSRVVDNVDLNHPLEAAEGRPVFELYPLAEGRIRSRGSDLARRLTTPARGAAVPRLLGQPTRPVLVSRDVYGLLMPVRPVPPGNCGPRGPTYGAAWR